MFPDQIDGFTAGFFELMQQPGKDPAVLWPVRLGQGRDHGRIARMSSDFLKQPVDGFGFFAVAGRTPLGDGLTTCVLVEDRQMDGFAPLVVALGMADEDRPAQTRGVFRQNRGQPLLKHRTIDAPGQILHDPEEGPPALRQDSLERDGDSRQFVALPERGVRLLLA